MNILGRSKQLVFFKKHPETAIRYYPVVQYLKSHNLLNSKILEIGSGSIGIAPYLRRKIIGVDLDFSEGDYPLLKQVYGSALKLPFPKKHFDVVIMSDVLEHISPKDRKKVITEAVRVCKRIVLISGPFGEKSYQQDKKLSDYSKIKLGKAHHFFDEHIKFGLPNINHLISQIRQIKRVGNIEVVGEYFNLAAREWLMKRFLAKSKLGYYFYLKGLMPAVPILRRLNKKPGYRILLALKLRG